MMPSYLNNKKKRVVYNLIEETPNQRYSYTKREDNVSPHILCNVYLIINL